jgi:hypothetical protein
MGAREDLLAAAHSLTARGMALFSPTELNAQARSEGSTYSDSTLRTHIVSVMCGNAPDHHSTRCRDFERVARAMYRLTSDWPSVVPIAEPASRVVESRHPPDPNVRAVPLDHDDEWFWEGNVQAAVVSHLARQGWQIMRVASTSSNRIRGRHRGGSGRNEAPRGGQGLSRTTYAKGDRKGETKTSPPATQARTYFGNALLAGLLMRAESEERS